MRVAKSVEIKTLNASRLIWVAKDIGSTVSNAQCEPCLHTVDTVTAEFVATVSFSETPFTVVTNAQMMTILVTTKPAEKRMNKSNSSDHILLVHR